MATVISCGAVVRNEVDAINKIATQISDWEDYALLTNFGGLNSQTREIDALLVTYNSVVCLELKHYQGTILASANSEWSTLSTFGDLDPRNRYPLRQAKTASISLRNHLTETGILPDRMFWFSYAVVLTHPESRLFYAASEADVLQYQAFHINEFSRGIERHFDAHENNIRSSRQCTPNEIELLLHRIGISQGAYGDHIRGLRLRFEHPNQPSRAIPNTPRTHSEMPNPPLIANTERNQRIISRSQDSSPQPQQQISDTERNRLFARGEELAFGDDDNPDYGQALRLFERSAELGHIGALRFLGQMNELGLGTKQFLAKAHSFYENAISKGDREAVNDLETVKQHIVGTSFLGNMAFSVFRDGSVLATTPESKLFFTSLNDLRASSAWLANSQQRSS